MGRFISPSIVALACSLVVDAKSRITSKVATSSAVSSSKAGYIYVSGCPPISIETVTTVVDPTVYTSTSTLTEPTYVYVTKTLSAISTTYVWKKTRTAYARTLTSTKFTGTATITVPTTPGFTPVRCEPSYYAKNTTVTDTNTQSEIFYTIFTSGTDTITPTFTTYTATTTSTLDTTTVTTASTVTVTSKTRTVYDACATNNLTPYLPDGWAAYFISNYGNYTTGITNSYGIAGWTIDAVTCCAGCQSNSTCTGFDWRVSDSQCVLFYKAYDRDICDPSFIGQSAGVGSVDGPYYFFGNGGCGSYDLGP